MIKVNSTNRPAETEPQVPCLAMRAREAAKALGISERLLWEWTNKGVVPHLRLGSAILYSVDELREWLKQSCQKNIKEIEKK